METIHQESYIIFYSNMCFAPVWMTEILSVVALMDWYQIALDLSRSFELCKALSSGIIFNTIQGLENK